jgi:chemotaxis protein methyltransferase CheR
MAHERDNAAPLPTDFLFTNRDFEWLRRVASEHSGIVLAETKRNMIYSRLSKRLRRLGLKKFSQYRALLQNGDSQEFKEFINALTTNLTSFFRERHHFEHLRHVALPELVKSGRTDRVVRIWSAGCSTGEEPYTISMTMRDSLEELGCGWDYRVLATDLDTKVLATAAAGVYSAERVATLEKSVLRRCFLRGTGSFEGMFRIRPELRAPISFKQLNLTKDWSIDEQFDLIFCRNVIIYFDRPTQKELFDKFTDLLAPGGYIYIGHSESLFQTQSRLTLVGKTTYQKTDHGPRGRPK